MIYSGSFIMSNKHNFDNHKINIDIFSSSSDFGVLRAKKILEDDTTLLLTFEIYEINL